MNRFKELIVWQESMKLAEEVYAWLDKFPREEQFNLTSQIKRSAVSIPSNIAEGAGRNHTKEFKQFLGIASGSVCELQTQLILSHKVGLLPGDALEQLEKRSEHIMNMLFKLQHSLKQRSASDTLET